MRRRLRYELARRVVGPVLVWTDRLLSWWTGRRRKPRASPLHPPPESTRQLKGISAVHFFSGRFAEGAVPVAWVTSGSPVELLRPLGYYLVYPENHGAICGAAHRSSELIDAAEEALFSQDLCSYARTDFGALITGKTPLGRIPKPDLLFCCTNICQTVLYWYRELARRLDVPMVVVDTPRVYGEPTREHLDYVVRQLREAAREAARVARRPLDEDRLAQTVRMARESCLLWGDCLATNQARPAPWTAFDSFIHMVPIVAMRGTEACNEYYRTLLAELRRRVKRGIGGVKQERFRLLWDNLPLWNEMRPLSRLLAAEGFALVAATYTNAWAETATSLAAEDPWEGMALAYSSVILNRDLDHRLRLTRDMARAYGCDGVVFHSNRSCKTYSVGQLELQRRLADEGYRALVLEADHADPRAYAAGQAETRLKAFMESFGATSGVSPPGPSVD